MSQRLHLRSAPGNVLQEPLLSKGWWAHRGRAEGANSGEDESVGCLSQKRLSGCRLMDVSARTSAGFLSRRK